MTLKRSYVEELKPYEKFSFHTVNLADVAETELDLGSFDGIFHLAAQAGVRASWGREFDVYLDENIRSSQILLEHCREQAPEVPLVVASSSSVYGVPDQLPMREDQPLQPYSPYGVTKLATENLGMRYARNFDLPVSALRFFTVYGPRQRPDMAFTRFLSWVERDQPITVYGDGTQTRDFTYVQDVVRALIACLEPEAFGRVFNVGGGERASLNRILEIMEDVTGTAIRRVEEPVPSGDVPHTHADTTLIRETLDWKPQVALEEGLARQWDWVRGHDHVHEAVDG